mgnify:CR=1 FL=1
MSLALSLSGWGSFRHWGIAAELLMNLLNHSVKLRVLVPVHDSLTLERVSVGFDMDMRHSSHNLDQRLELGKLRTNSDLNEERTGRVGQL